MICITGQFNKIIKKPANKTYFMAKIAFFELEQFGMGHKKDYIKQHLKGQEVMFFDEYLTKESAEKAKNAEIIAFFIYSKIDKDTIEKMQHVKLLTTMSTGFDHIDIEACKKKKIIACNVPAYGSNTVAEHAMALLLTISRKIMPSVERTRKGSFELKGLRGFDLQGKTMGIIGTGKIGIHMAHYAKAFDMQVIAFDLYPNKELAQECGYSYVELNELLSHSDVISLHLPETPQTHHLINKKNLHKIKKGCVLINTARGGLIETEALLEGMKDGTFSALGLDVLEQECFIKEEAELLHDTFTKQCELETLFEEHELIGMDNVYVTPHNAFNSEEALMRIIDTTLDNIHSFLDGVPKNTITKQQ